MTTMTFLTIPNGTLAYQDSAGSGTLTATSPTYAASYWAGTQGVTVGASTAINLPSADTALDPAAGSLVVRFRAPAGTSGYRNIIYLGGSAFVRLRLLPTTNVLEVAGNAGGSWSRSSGVAVTPGAEAFAYLAWGDEVVIAVGTDAPASRAMPSTNLYSSGALRVGYGPTDGVLTGGVVHGIAGFDAPLTDGEHIAVLEKTQPWTWGMALTSPVAGHIDVLPVTGVHPDAPVLTLP